MMEIWMILIVVIMIVCLISVQHLITVKADFGTQNVLKNVEMALRFLLKFVMMGTL